MTDLVHWCLSGGAPSELKEPPDCCRSAFDKVATKMMRDGWEALDQALRDERRRIVAALTTGIEAWERTARSLSLVGQIVVDSAVNEMRHLLAEAGCTCPQLEVTTLGDSKPRYTRGIDRYCGVHP